MLVQLTFTSKSNLLTYFAKNYSLANVSRCLSTSEAGGFHPEGLSYGIVRREIFSRGDFVVYLLFDSL